MKAYSSFSTLPHFLRRSLVLGSVSLCRCPADGSLESLTCPASWLPAAPTCRSGDAPPISDSNPTCAGARLRTNFVPSRRHEYLQRDPFVTAAGPPWRPECRGAPAGRVNAGRGAGRAAGRPPCLSRVSCDRTGVGHGPGSGLCSCGSGGQPQHREWGPSRRGKHRASAALPLPQRRPPPSPCPPRRGRPAAEGGREGGSGSGAGSPGGRCGRWPRRGGCAVPRCSAERSASAACGQRRASPTPSTCGSTPSRRGCSSVSAAAGPGSPAGARAEPEPAGLPHSAPLCLPQASRRTF